ncbi:MAG: hypothetical protein PHZ09_00350 [Eubacteriales bacterium]|jgi:hypothetical protein|nr:hypothetical protein [Eubacteriales bacterium]
MKTKSLTALFLLFAIIFSCFSCASNNNAESGVTTAVTGETTAGETEISDDLPDTDYEGYKFRFYTRNCCPSHAGGLYTEELSGDVIEDAVYRRNRDVEDRFNIEITEPLTGADGNATELISSVAAGDDICDAVVWHFRHLGDVALQGLLYDLQNIPHLNFNKPWWSKNIIDSYTIFDKSFVALGYYDIDNITFTGCMYFNKRLADEYLPDNLYETTNTGAFTLDKFIEYTRLVGADLNGDASVDIENDLYGFGTAAGLMFMFQSAADQPTTKRDEDGTPVLAINTERMVSIVEKCYSLLHEYEYSYVHEAGAMTAFTAGRILFHTGLLTDATGASMRDMDDDFGILPFPKFDETQSEYYSHGSAHGALIGIPVTIIDTERTGLLTEAITAEGYKTIRPAVYDVALKTKLTRDEDSAAMIDIILGGRTGDYADIYDEWGLVYTLDHMVGRKKDNNFASYYAANEKASIDRIQKSVDKFSEMG